MLFSSSLHALIFVYFVRLPVLEAMVRGKLARDVLLIQQISAADIQRVWRSHAERNHLLGAGGAVLLPTSATTSGEGDGNAETLRLLNLEMHKRSLTILRDVLDGGRVVFGQRCIDPRSFFHAADRRGRGALDRSEVEHALQRLDLGLSSGQLGSLIDTLWDLPPMSPREIRSASERTTQGQASQIDASQTSPQSGSASPAVLNSLLLDSVTEDEFVAWADPHRVQKAMFLLRRRTNQPAKRQLDDKLGSVPLLTTRR